MKKVKSISITCMSLSFLLMVGSCKKNIRAVVLQQYPGNSLIIAIHDGDKQLLEYMPELKEAVAQYANTPEKEDALEKFTVDLIKKVETDDPAFYNDFAHRIADGNIEKADKALQDGISRMTEEVKAYGDNGQLSVQQLFDKIFKDYQIPKQ